MKKISAASTLRLNFSLALVDGELVEKEYIDTHRVESKSVESNCIGSNNIDSNCIDSNFDQPPVKYTMGSGDMLPGFERELLGMLASEEKTSVVSAAQAFGERLEQNIQRFKPAHFDPGLQLEEGLVVAFADAAGAELPGVISAVSSDFIDVDFNHPLAGKDIEFKVLIDAVLD